MLKPEAQAAWGNRVGLLPLRVPIMGRVENPMEFVRLAELIMARNKMFLGVFINARLMGYVTGLKGPQASNFNFQVFRAKKIVSCYLMPL